MSPICRLKLRHQSDSHLQNTQIDQSSLTMKLHIFR
jgi:hypothetical protein